MCTQQGKAQLPQGATIVKLVTSQAGQGNKQSAIITSTSSPQISHQQIIGQVFSLAYHVNVFPAAMDG